MTGGWPRAGRLILLASAAAWLMPRAAQAQFDPQFSIEQGDETGPTVRHPSPQNFAFQLSFGPYRPNVDSEFNSGRQPYQEYFGSGSKLLSQAEFDFELLHQVGTLALGLGFSYFQVSGPSPIAGPTTQLSGDRSSLTVIPFSVSAIYRFDYYLKRKNFPLVPYGKLGLDYAYWQITDGNGEIATDGRGGRARGGTAGWHAAAGVELVLDMLDPDAARTFDMEMGVNHTALVFEYGHADISGLGAADKLHVGDDTWLLGILLEF
jgi:hypothetical protein